MNGERPAKSVKIDLTEKKLHKILANRTVIQAQKRRILHLQRENEKMKQCLKQIIRDLDDLKSWTTCI